MCVATFFHCPDCLRTYDIPFLNPAVVFKNTSVVFDCLCSNQTCGRLSEIAIRDHLPYTTSFLHNSTCGSPGCTLAVCNSSFIFRRCSDTSLNIRRIVRVADEFDAGPAYFFPPSCAKASRGTTAAANQLTVTFFRFWRTRICDPEHSFFEIFARKSGQHLICLDTSFSIGLANALVSWNPLHNLSLRSPTIQVGLQRHFLHLSYLYLSLSTLQSYPY